MLKLLRKLLGYDSVVAELEQAKIALSDMVSSRDYHANRADKLERDLQRVKDSAVAQSPHLVTEVVKIRKEEVTLVLPQNVYDKFERGVANTVVTSQTSELEAGYKLGVQHVLKEIRNGFVVPDSK